MGNRGAHRAIMIGEEAHQRQLYNLTLAGWIDFGWNELSSANDTFTTIDIAVYPDGVTRTELHHEVKTETDCCDTPLGYFSPIDLNLYILPQNDNAYLELTL